MGRDVGRDEGREQAEWRDLVARLELPAPIDQAQAPWPDRENLRTTLPPPATGHAAGSQPGASESVGQIEQEGVSTGPLPTTDASQPDGTGRGDLSHGTRGPADRSRVIRPAGSTRSCGAAGEPVGMAGEGGSSAYQPGGDQGYQEMADLAGPTPFGPRDYELDEPAEDNLDDDDAGSRYVPPPLPPSPQLDPVAKGAWLALFGGPGYLLLATLLNWQIAGWSALTAVVAFVTGFVVLVVKLGDGPSKRDGPDQGAVV